MLTAHFQTYPDGTYHGILAIDSYVVQDCEGKILTPRAYSHGGYDLTGYRDEWHRATNWGWGHSATWCLAKMVQIAIEAERDALAKSLNIF